MPIPCFASAFGGAADMAGLAAGLVPVENDPGCVKTHTSAKCRKHNSPARHRTSRVQYDLTLSDAIVRRYFYVWRDRWSFRTAKTQLGHDRVACCKALAQARSRIDCFG